MKLIWSLYNLKLPIYFVYMLQQVEYDPSKFHSWLKRLISEDKKINGVMHRKELVYTLKAKLMLVATYIFILASLFVDAAFVYSETTVLSFINLFFWIFWVPIYVYIFLLLLTWCAHRLFIRPKQRKLVNEAKKIFAQNKAVKIAVLGSYGKTTMKELLATVLTEGKKVAVTPGNMNVSVSHARFARKLKGDEEVIIVEFGEGEPGDIARMADMLQPDYAILTGLAPNHLDLYPNLAAVAHDFREIYNYVDSENVLVSAESKMLQEYLPENAQKFSLEEVLGWSINDTSVSIHGVQFTMKKGSLNLQINSALLGRHQVAPIAVVAALADKLGLERKSIEEGISKTKPFEHRMQPRLLQGAWLIDDTYNGNLEGMQAGLALLNELEAKRKWYVTPGLVDQGSETGRVHIELGKAIAEANPDIVVLMENSVRPIIEKSMKDNGFNGDLRIESNPLEFYTSIEHVLAVGDLLLMQNDWTDNYN